MRQLELPIATPQRRRKSPESREFYAQVLALRRAGHRVYRAGRKVSVIDGEYRGDSVVTRLGKRFSRKEGD